MGNHNVLKTNPTGDRSNAFPENVTRDQCVEWLKTYGPAPKGWHYQITNSNRDKKRKHPEHVLVTGFAKDGTFVNHVEARHKTNDGWYTVRMAKRDLRKQGASWFTTEKKWETDDGNTPPWDDANV